MAASQAGPETGTGGTKTVYVLHGREIASHGRRLAAMLIDGAIVGVIIFMMFGVVISGEISEMPWQSAAGLTIAFLTFYHMLIWTAFSASPGKMMLRLQIVDRNGWRIGIVQSVGRLIGYALSTSLLGIGFIWMFVDRFSRGWHDLLAGTYVIYEGPKKARSRNMASHLFGDLVTGPSTIRQVEDPAAVATAAPHLNDPGSQRIDRNVRYVSVDDALQEQETRPGIGDYPVASFSHRLRAFGLDAMASLVAALAALFVLSIWIPPTLEASTGVDYARQDAIRLSIILALFFGYVVYPIASNWMFKTTGGKRLMNLQVVDSNGGNVGLLRLTLRQLAYIVSTVPVFLGFIAALTDDYSRSWHDRIAGTYVTYKGGGSLSDLSKARRKRVEREAPTRSHWPTE